MALIRLIVDVWNLHHDRDRCGGGGGYWVWHEGFLLVSGPTSY